MACRPGATAAVNEKQVPLSEVTRLRQDRRQLRALLSIAEAENQGLRVENARLIVALQERSEGRRPNYETG